LCFLDHTVQQVSNWLKAGIYNLLLDYAIATTMGAVFVLPGWPS